MQNMLNYVEMYYGHTDIRKNATIGLAYMTQDRLSCYLLTTHHCSDRIANFATRVLPRRLLSAYIIAQRV